IAEHLATAVGKDVTVVAPDAGGGKLARRFANHLGDLGVETDLAFIDKRRPKGTHNVAEAVEVVGDIAGRSCVLVDDMIDTGGTDVTIAATHGVLSGSAVERLADAPVREVVVTNTIPIPDEKSWPGLTVLSIAPIIAEALKAVFEDTSVSEIFRGDNM